MSDDVASGSAWGGVAPVSQDQPRQKPTDARRPLDRRALEDAMILSGSRGSDDQRAVRVGELQEYLGGLSQQFQVPINNLSGLIADPALLFRNAGLSAPEIVDVLPDFSNFPGRLVFLTTDNKLYRWTGTEWTASVPAVDVIGQLTNEQIAEIAAAKIAGQLTDAQIASIDAAKIAGQIATAQIDDAAITDAKIAGLAASKITGQLTDSQVAAVAAAKVTGQIVAGQIADAAVTTAKFASGIRPVEIVSSLPTTGNFAGRIVFLTTDSKQYRHTGSPTGSAGFTASVPAVDITGQISAAQIANEVTGAITTAQAAADTADDKANAIRADHDELVQGFTGTLNAAFTNVSATISDLESSIEVDIASLTNAVDAVSATVTSETTARITADTAEANARQSLATQLRGTYSGTDIANVQAGLIHSERQARITQDSNLQTQINTIVAASSGDFGDLFAAIEEESTARITADSALAGNFSDLTARLNNVILPDGTPSNKTVEATISDDRVARVNGDASLAADILGLNSAIDGVSATLTTSHLTTAQTNSAISAAQKTLRSEVKARTIMADFQEDGAFWSQSINGAPLPKPDLGSPVEFVTDASLGRIARLAAPIASNRHFAPKAYLPNVAGKRWRVTVTARHNGAFAGNSQSSIIFLARRYNSAYSSPSLGDIFFSSLPFTATDQTEVFTKEFTMDGSTPFVLPFIFVPAVNFGVAGPVIDIKMIEFTEVSAARDVSANLEANYYTETQTNSAIAAASQTLQGSISGLSSTVTTQGTAIATLEGNASAGYLIRAQAGNQVSLLDLIAADGVSGPVSVAKISATNIILDGSVTATSLGVGSVTADKIASNAVTAIKVTAGAITADKIASAAVTADKVAANAITAGKIAADAVTAGTIAAGAVSADEIAAGSVTASKVLIGDRSNMIPDPGLDDPASWILGSNFSIAAASSFEIAEKVIIWNATTTSGASNAFVADAYVSEKIRIDPTRDYAVGGVFRTNSGGMSGRAQTQVMFYNATDSSPIQFATVQEHTVGGTTAQQKYSSILTPPGGAVYARFRMRVARDANGNVGGPMRWYHNFLRPAAAGELIVDGAITAEKITSNAVTAEKIAAGSVVADKIASNAVTAVKISAGAVEAAKIAAGAIDATKIAAGAVTADKVAANAIAAGNIVSGAVTTAKLAAGAVTADTIATNAVTAVKISAGAVEAAKIAAGAVVADKIAANAITSVKIAAGAVTANEIAGNTITGNKIVANTITGGLLATSGIITQVAQIGDGLITNAKIANAAITRAKIGSAAIGTAQIENGAITNALIGNAAVGTLQVAGEAITAARYTSADYNSNPVLVFSVDLSTAHQFVFLQIPRTQGLVTWINATVQWDGGGMSSGQNAIVWFRIFREQTAISTIQTGISFPGIRTSSAFGLVDGNTNAGPTTYSIRVQKGAGNTAPTPRVLQASLSLHQFKR